MISNLAGEGMWKSAYLGGASGAQFNNAKKRTQKEYNIAEDEIVVEEKVVYDWNHQGRSATVKNIRVIKRIAPPPPVWSRVVNGNSGICYDVKNSDIKQQTKARITPVILDYNHENAATEQDTKILEEYTIPETANVSSHRNCGETSGKIASGGTSDKIASFETSNKIASVETSGKVPFFETIGKIPFVETNGKIPFVETNGKIPFVETNGKIPFVETNGKIPFVETSDKIPFVETSDKIPFVETSDKIPFVETSDKIPFVETKDNIPFVETSDKIPFVETNDDKIAYVETNDKIASVETSDEIAIVETSDKIAITSKKTAPPEPDSSTKLTPSSYFNLQCRKRKWEQVVLLNPLYKSPPNKKTAWVNDIFDDTSTSSEKYGKDISGKTPKQIQSQSCFTLSNKSDIVDVSFGNDTRMETLQDNMNAVQNFSLKANGYSDNSESGKCERKENFESDVSTILSIEEDLATDSQYCKIEDEHSNDKHRQEFCVNGIQSFQDVSRCLQYPVNTMDKKVSVLTERDKKPTSNLNTSLSDFDVSCISDISLIPMDNESDIEILFEDTESILLSDVDFNMYMKGSSKIVNIKSESSKPTQNTANEVSTESIILSCYK